MSQPKGNCGFLPGVGGENRSFVKFWDDLSDGFDQLRSSGQALTV